MHVVCCLDEAVRAIDLNGGFSKAALIETDAVVEVKLDAGMGAAGNAQSAATAVRSGNMTRVFRYEADLIVGARGRPALGKNPARAVGQIEKIQIRRADRDHVPAIARGRVDIDAKDPDRSLLIGSSRRRVLNRNAKLGIVRELHLLSVSGVWLLRFGRARDQRKQAEKKKRKTSGLCTHKKNPSLKVPVVN